VKMRAGAERVGSHRQSLREIGDEDARSPQPSFPPSVYCPRRGCPLLAAARAKYPKALSMSFVQFCRSNSRYSEYFTGSALTGRRR